MEEENQPGDYLSKLYQSMFADYIWSCGNETRNVLRLDLQAICNVQHLSRLFQASQVKCHSSIKNICEAFMRGIKFKKSRDRRSLRKRCREIVRVVV